MVVFTCNHCGESLHKPKVEKHYQFQCRNYKSVTCVDCFKDFKNEEYVVHTKCITEDERYSAKGTYKNGIIKKGDVKQDSWLEMIKSICDIEKNLKPSVRKLFETISEYSNVPRKKAKFVNFIKSSSGNRVNMQEVEEVWDIIEKYKYKNAPDQQNNVNNTQKKEGQVNEDISNQVKKRSKGDDAEESPKKKKKKASEETQESVDNNQIQVESKREKKPKPESEESSSINDTIDSIKFDYTAKILEILTKKQNISHKKLQKKVLKAYLSATGQSECEEKVIKKFNKKLKKMPNVGIEDNRVMLQA